MTCAIVICSLVLGGGPKECDTTKPPARVAYLPAADRKDCGAMLRSAQLMRRPGEWPMRGDLVGRKPKGDEE
jgi:hypothetical protein